MSQAVEFTPDHEAIRADLEWMTRRWSELSDAVEFELRAFKEDTRPQTARFAAADMDEAVHWASDLNLMGYNLYVVRNPIRAAGAGSAKDGDVVAAFFLWADCDDEGAADNVRRFDGPKYNAAVVTGRVPSVRVHTYWELQEPCRDMAAWRALQIGIARHFRSDDKVINPSRIMRVGGTVAWPDSRKREKGYAPHLTELKVAPDPDARPPVTIEQMQRVFAGQPAPSWQFDVGAAPLDRERTRIQALSGQEWHHSVIRLVASYVSKGLSDAEIHGLTDPLTLAGYTVEQTRREVQVAIDGARAKGWTPEAAEPAFDHPPVAKTPQGAGTASWTVQRADAFVADFVAPEYLIDGVMQRGRLYTLTAPTGHGKTAAMLYASVAVGTGMQFCGCEVERGAVLFLAGENPDDVRARVIAASEFYGVPADRLDVHFVAGTFSIRKDMQRLVEAARGLPGLVMVVVDTFAAYFDGDDENSNAQALDFARVVRRLTELPTKPAVVMPAHPVKNAGRQNLSPKGGSSLVNEVDGNLTIWNDDGMLKLHWQVKHRGPDFEPLTMELQRYECDRLVDRKGRKMPSILAKPVLQLRAAQLAKEALSKEDALLLNIADGPALSFSERCRALGYVTSDGREQKSSLFKVRDRLIAQKLVKPFRAGRMWELTKDGERAVEMIQQGVQMPPEVQE